MVLIIICPQCLRYSALPGDITNRWCANCRRQTNGKVVELPDPGRVVDGQREQALYAIELYAARAMANHADQDQVLAALRRGMGTFLVASHTPAPWDCVVAKLAAGAANEWDLIYRGPQGAVPPER